MENRRIKNSSSSSAAHREFEANGATEDSVSITVTCFRDKDDVFVCLSAELMEQPFPYGARVL